MNSVFLLTLGVVAVVNGYTTSYNLGEPQNRQFYYYNRPPTDHLIHRNYNYQPYSGYPNNGNINYNDYGYGLNGYVNPQDPAYFMNQQGYVQSNYGYRQPYYGGINDPYAPNEIRQRQDDLRRNDIDLSAFKLHHQHHPNKDRVGLKPGHDGGLHGVSFGNDGYGN